MTLEKIKTALAAVMVVVTLLNASLTVKDPMDKVLASQIIQDSYAPLMSLVEDLSITDDSEKLRVPETIKNMKDFEAYMHPKLKASIAQGIYENWIIEEEGQLYADSGYYIPTIYDDSRIITKAYIRIRQPFINKFFYKKESSIKKELIIKERLAVYNTTYNARTYYYELDQNNQWILDHVNGTGSIGFVDPSHNPWSELWKEETNEG